MRIESSTGAEKTYYDIHSWRQLILSSPEVIHGLYLPAINGAQSQLFHPSWNADWFYPV